MTGCIRGVSVGVGEGMSEGVSVPGSFKLAICNAGNNH